MPPRLPIDLLKKPSAISKKPQSAAKPTSRPAKKAISTKKTPSKTTTKKKGETAVVPTKPSVTPTATATAAEIKTGTGGMPIEDALKKVSSQAPGLYAKLLIHNFAFTVTPRDTIITHRMRDVNVGDVLRLDQIREVGSKDYLVKGLPLLPTGKVTVTATVMEHTEGAKKRARMRKQRKGRRAFRTIKPQITVLRIQDIQINE